MRRIFLILALSSCLLSAGSAQAHGTEIPDISGFPQVLVTTTHGELVIELEPSRAPITVGNFIDLVKKGYYKDTVFHRVIAGFVAQGGGHRVDYSALPDTPTIVNESGNGLSNMRGTIAMARESKPHTANSQFYINLVDNTKLDPSRERWGYTVFGRVVSGMETIDRISDLPTGPAGPFESDFPAMPVIVKTMKILTNKEVEARSAAELEAAEKMLEALEEDAQ